MIKYVSCVKRYTFEVQKRCFSATVFNKMRFVQFQRKSGGVQHIGAQTSLNGDIFDITEELPSKSTSMLNLLTEESDILEQAKRIVAAGKSAVPLSEVNLLPPITNPDKIACVGLNYSGHCDELKIPYPKEPIIFSKFSSTIIGPYDTIKLPKISDQIDWEVELVVVIGKQGKNIKQEEVSDYIFGYTMAQDLGARDWFGQKNGGQFLLGKTMDTFCPLGPSIVTKDELNAQNLNLKTYVNGVLKQNGNTSELIFKSDFLVSYLSQFMTLYPGDLILTGTPGGVGASRKPPEFLKSGDVLETEIEGIGKMKNNVE